MASESYLELRVPFHRRSLPNLCSSLRLRSREVYDHRRVIFRDVANQRNKGKKSHDRWKTHPLEEKNYKSFLKPKFLAPIQTVGGFILTPLSAKSISAKTLVE